MEDIHELKRAIRNFLEKERELEAARRRLAELSGAIPEREQRRKKASRPEDFARACGL